MIGIVDLLLDRRLGGDVGSGKVLLVEENRDEAKLASLLLKTELPSVEVVQVEDWNTLEEALDSVPYDLVLSENRFSWGDGSRVLSLVRRSRPGCPVVILTGSGSEETACEVIKNGAADYVPKSARGYVTLAKKVQGILAGGNSAGVSAMVAQYQRLLEIIDDAVFVAARDGLLLEVNPAFGSLVKSRGPAAARGRNLADFVQNDVLLAFLDKLDPKGEPGSADMGLRGGTEVVRMTACLFSQGNRLPTLVVGKLNPVDETSRPLKGGAPERQADNESRPDNGEVDLEKVLDRVLADLKLLIERSRATVTRGKMPAIEAPYLDMVRLFQNLLSTVLKVPTQEPAKIEISVYRMPVEWLFIVKDSGSGLAGVQPEPQAANSPDKEREEPGESLASSRRIVEYLGGRLWISNSNEGSTVYFTLPTQRRDHQKAAECR